MAHRSQLQENFKGLAGLVAFVSLGALIILVLSCGAKVWAMPGQTPLRDTVPGGVAGKAYLQGRSDHSGVTITIGETGKQGVSVANGSYAVADVPPGTYVVTATMPNYLYARRENVAVEEDTITTLPDVTLLSGDAKSDGVVNIFDLVIVGSNYTKSVPPGDPRADINGDGRVNIFDLVLVGTNYTKTAPGPWP
jgi:hypothetical protein